MSEHNSPLESQHESVPTRSHAQQWLADYGDQLYAYALARVTHPSIAEDLVQETLLAALKNAPQFSQQSAAGTWLTGILRHKIYDHYRRERRNHSVSLTGDTELPEGDAQSSSHGCGPLTWGRGPSSSLENHEFWKVFDDCRRQLPLHLAETFVMRELDELETQEICKILNITSTNLAVRIHRARMLLRKCLESHWFAP